MTQSEGLVPWRELMEALQAERPELFEARELTVAAAVDELAEQLDRVDSLLNERIPSADFEPLLSICDLISVQFYQIARMTDPEKTRASDEPSLFWPSIDRDDTELTLHDLSLNLAQTLMASRALILCGHGGSSRMLLRRFVEVADITVAIGYDKEFFLKFINADRAPNRDYWHKHLAPKHVRPLIARLDSEMNGETETESNEWFAQVRAGTYTNLSNFAHVHPIGVRISNLVPEAAGLQVLAMTAHYGYVALAQLQYLFRSDRHEWQATTWARLDERVAFFFWQEVLDHVAHEYASTMYGLASGRHDVAMPDKWLRPTTNPVSFRRRINRS
jgi:hypothetical protein